MTPEPILLTVAVLAFHKERETRLCLESLRANLRVPHKTVLLDNGSASDWAWQCFKEGLCDTLITKRESLGGGVGQTDLFRWSDTPYTLFVQSDQVLAEPIEDASFQWMLSKLANGFKCVDLNGDQSRRGAWTDRAHLINTDFFNSLHPFPNGGPGNDAAPWNEAYLQEVFRRPENQIFHPAAPLFFQDIGKWSVRKAGDGILKHRCDTKQMYVIKQPTYRTEVYPPLNDAEWQIMLSGKWVDGTIPEEWKRHSFEVPQWRSEL